MTMISTWKIRLHKREFIVGLPATIYLNTLANIHSLACLELYGTADWHCICDFSALKSITVTRKVFDKEHKYWKKKNTIPHNILCISNFPLAPNTWWMEISILPKVLTAMIWGISKQTIISQHIKRNSIKYSNKFHNSYSFSESASQLWV